MEDEIKRNETIRDLYINKSLGCRRISQIVGLSKSAVHDRLVKMGIPRRSFGRSWYRNVRAVGHKWCDKRTGYVYVTVSDGDFFYPMADMNERISEHRLVMAKHLGRCLHSWEIVHHKNHIRADNRIENLQLVSVDKHMQLTILERKITRLENKVSEQDKVIKLLQWNNMEKNIKNRYEMAKLQEQTGI